MGCGVKKYVGSGRLLKMLLIMKERLMPGMMCTARLYQARHTLSVMMTRMGPTKISAQKTWGI